MGQKATTKYDQSVWTMLQANDAETTSAWVLEMCLLEKWEEDQEEEYCVTQGFTIEAKKAVEMKLQRLISEVLMSRLQNVA